MAQQALREVVAAALLAPEGGAAGSRHAAGPVTVVVLVVADVVVRHGARAVRLRPRVWVLQLTRKWLTGKLSQNLTCYMCTFCNQIQITWEKKKTVEGSSAWRVACTPSLPPCTVAQSCNHT